MIPATMSTEEVFIYVTKHLLAQKEKSKLLSDGACLYRNGQLKCSVGCLIRDEEYNRTFEGKSIGTLLAILAYQDVNHPIVMRLKKHEEVLTRLQHIHDEQSVNDWVTLLRYEASFRGYYGFPFTVSEE